MLAFKYKGVDSAGSPVAGRLSAGSVEEAERRLVAQDVTIISIIPAGAGRNRSKESASNATSGAGKRSLPPSESGAILQNLAVMCESGVPFVEALEAAKLGAKSERTAALLDVLQAEIIAGKSLSTAMRTAAGLFPPLVADMVRVAEEGGRLDHALKTAATHLEREAELRKRVLNAMLYPIVMLTISTLTVLVLVVVVMPKFAGIFVRMNVEVPASTQLMLSAGEFIRQNPLGFIVGFFGALFGLRAALRTQSFYRFASKLWLRLPMLGPLLRNLAYSRSFGSLATLLSGNVPIIAALEHSAKVAGVPEVREAFLNARIAVENGRSLTEALGEGGTIPPTLLQMVSVGEKTGKLNRVMATAAERLESDVDSRLKALVSIVEPVMIVFMGLLVGGITVSIIGPIYSVVQNIK